MTEVEPVQNYDRDIENFTHDLVVAIWDLNKKYSLILFRTNLGNQMLPLIRWVNEIKEQRKKEQEKKNE